MRYMDFTREYGNTQKSDPSFNINRNYFGGFSTTVTVPLYNTRPQLSMF